MPTIVACARGALPMPDPNSNPWLDVSVPLHAGLPVWPGDPPLVVSRERSLDRGDSANVTRLELGAHTGTHVDAPVHFVAAGASVDRMPLDATVGPARVIAIPAAPAIRRDVLERAAIREGERILLRTANSDRAWFREPFRRDFVALALDAAELLAERRVRCVGVDYLSVGPFADEPGNARTHRVLLEAGVWIVEGLELSAIKPGDWELVCLPLRVEGADGAPARALLRRA
ncbi:MAG TPA: cyclase family protein [Anaeromyxobacteraceae bacterium]|nr:cyclase family protein [Anaeromyxobacteraceae bacterium]